MIHELRPTEGEIVVDYFPLQEQQQILLVV